MNPISTSKFRTKVNDMKGSQFNSDDNNYYVFIKCTQREVEILRECLRKRYSPFSVPVIKIQEGDTDIVNQMIWEFERISGILKAMNS